MTKQNKVENLTVEERAKGAMVNYKLLELSKKKCKERKIAFNLIYYGGYFIFAVLITVIAITVIYSQITWATLTLEAALLVMQIICAYLVKDAKIDYLVAKDIKEEYEAKYDQKPPKAHTIMESK